MQYAYVLQNQSGQFYTGCTSDLKKRLVQHNTGKSEFTKYRGLYELIYYEACLSVKDAYARGKISQDRNGQTVFKEQAKEIYNRQRYGMNPVRLHLNVRLSERLYTMKQSSIYYNFNNVGV